MTARGDVRTQRSSGRGRGGGGGSSFYDDQGRGTSKSIWEWFESNYTAANFSKTWLMDLPDEKCYWLLKNSVERHGLVDIAYYWTPGWNEYQDTRAHRLVIKHLKESDWCDFHKHLVEGCNNHRAKLDQERKEAATKRDQQYAIAQAQREAAQAIVRREDYEQIQQTVSPTVGMFEAELNTAFRYHDQVGDAGDWIEEGVDTFVDGSGYGYEQSKATGIKLQVTVSLDLSNSMYYNGVHAVAAETFRNLCLTLEELKKMYTDDLYTAYFTFSLDWYEKAGKRVDQLVYTGTPKDEYDLKALTEFSPSNIKAWSADYWGHKGPFQGEDTWVSPLFEAIERWEKEESDPGAAKLDIIITDAVLEHPMDIRQSDVIQERRDGTLSSVFVNFMKQENWLNSTMPKRCFQMAVDKDNVAGILRQILMEFVSVKS